MIKWLLRRAIDRFERDWKYDAGYIRDMIDASSRAAWLFSRVTEPPPWSWGSDLPHRLPHRSPSGRPPSVFTP